MPTDDPLALAAAMVDQQLRARGFRDEAVLGAMARVPRHRFVPHVPLEEAYGDQALPTAAGQTISQPYMVALMTEALRVAPGLKVLEIGTGSGYQTAILAELGARVVSIERYADLANSARQRLEELGYGGRVQVVVGDGTLGWPAEAPYDRILVTAGAPAVPPAYGAQLADSGRLVIPVGDRADQRLLAVTRHGERYEEALGVGCRFVPLVGAAGWKAENED